MFNFNAMIRNVSMPNPGVTESMIVLMKAMSLIVVKLILMIDDLQHGHYFVKLSNSFTLPMLFRL